MPTFAVPWLEQLSVQVTELNEDHHHILDKLNCLLTALSMQDPTAVMLACNDLRAEAVAHFDEEEKRMRETAYPEIDMHCEHHQRLLRGLSALQFQVSTVDYFLTMRDTFPFLFLESWFIPHLLNDDKQLGEYLARRTAPARAAASVRKHTDLGLPESFGNDSGSSVSMAGPVSFSGRRDRRQPMGSRRLADRRQAACMAPAAQLFMH